MTSKGSSQPSPASERPRGSEQSGGRSDHALKVELNRLLIQSIKDLAIYAIDPTGHVMSWNPGAQRIKGYTPDEILGRDFSTFYTAEDVRAGKPQHMLEQALANGRVETEGWRVRKDGTRFWAGIIMTPLRSDTGEHIGFAKVTRDMTARRDADEAKARQVAAEAAHAEAARRSEELEMLNGQLQNQAAELEMQTAELEMQTEELRALKNQLEDTNEELHASLVEAEAARDAAERAAVETATAYRELDQFAYLASHDLKAPLRGISNLAQWIRDDLGDALPPQSVDHVRMLQGRVQRMEALIDGILAYSRAGRARKDFELVDSGKAVAEVIEFIAPPPGVRVEVSPDMPTLLTERLPFRQVLQNLIGNAAKHGAARRPDLVIRIDCRAAGDAFEFSVSDNGPGIAPEYHDRIWAIFQTLEPRDKVENTGIGLSLVRKIVESWGGRAWIESTAGHGATFRFTCPRSPEPERVTK